MIPALLRDPTPRETRERLTAAVSEANRQAAQARARLRRARELDAVCREILGMERLPDETPDEAMAALAAEVLGVAP